MGREGRFYNEKFYRELDSTRESAAEILPIVIELLKPSSIVDIGCGSGHWLAAATKLGVTDILGVDGDWVKESQLAIPRDKFVPHDLSTPLKLGRRFDLALSLEVAEHLPESAASIFIRNLCGAADIVLFSAAIPGQGGRHHVNEQWPAYWADLFQDAGYQCYDVLRPRIWNNPRVAWYYAQNCMIFARKNVSSLGTPGCPFALVHPTLWSNQVAGLRSPGKLLERLPKAILSKVLRRP